MILGLLLLAAGTFVPGHKAPLTEANVNLYAGIVTLLFGGVLLWMARRAS